MAWFQVSFFSHCHQRSVPLNVILPIDVIGPNQSTGDKTEFRTLYLLHGYMGNYTDWLLNAQVQEISLQYNLAIVMPSGNNSFYVDQPHSGMNGSQFIAKELVEFTRTAFPLSRKAEDTIIGGLSMGGYGTLYNALSHGDVFGHAIALSTPVNAYKGEDPNAAPDMGLTRGFFEALHGDLSKVEESDRNIARLAATVLAEKRPVTNLYIACGYNDKLVHENRELHEALDAAGFPHFYEEGPGTHEWAFWNAYLRRGLEQTLSIEAAPFENPFWTEKTEYDYSGRSGK